MREEGKDESGWQPGTLDRLRALTRRLLIRTVGRRTEAYAHALYHRVLRALGRFGPPEDDATREVLRSVASRSQTIIDVGANVGRYAWFLRRHARAQSTVIAMEPHPGAARLLRAALAANPGCVVLEVAAADTDGHASLHVPEGAFGTPVPALSWLDRHGDTTAPATIQVPIRRIDSLIEDGTITVNAPVLMKIDVEGSEAMVLRGAAGLVRRHRPAIYFECQATHLSRQGETPEGVWQLLGQAGYRVFAIGPGGLRAMTAASPDVVNYLALPDFAPEGAGQPQQETPVGERLDRWARDALEH